MFDYGQAGNLTGGGGVLGRHDVELDLRAEGTGNRGAGGRPRPVRTMPRVYRLSRSLVSKS